MNVREEKQMQLENDTIVEKPTRVTDMRNVFGQQNVYSDAEKKIQRQFIILDLYGLAQ